MVIKEVFSGCIKGFALSEDRSVLRVVLKSNGNVYDYFTVSDDIIVSFIHDFGVTWNAKIRGRFNEKYVGKYTRA